MAEILTPRIDRTAQPLVEKLGFSADLGITKSPALLFTEGGAGLNLQLKCDVAESVHELHSFVALFSRDLTKGRYVPGSDYNPPGDASSVPGYDVKRESVMIGLGLAKRWILSYGKDTRPDRAFRFEHTPLVGPGWRRQEQGGQTVDERTSYFDGTSAKTINFADRLGLAFEMRPSGSRWPAYTFGINAMFGVEYAGEDSKYNRAFLNFGISVAVGYGDAATNAGKHNSSLGDVYGLEVLAHSLVLLLLMNETLLKPRSDLNDY